MRPTLLILIFYSACTSAASPSGITTAELTCPPDSTLTYENFGKAFLEDNCLSCHTNRDSPTMTSDERIVASKQAIIDAAVIATKMPKGASLSVDERSMLGEWLTCGAP